MDTSVHLNQYSGDNRFLNQFQLKKTIFLLFSRSYCSHCSRENKMYFTRNMDMTDNNQLFINPEIVGDD